MDPAELLADLAHRPAAAARALPAMDAAALNAHPGGHPNSPAWLLWHAGRQLDAQLAALTGAGQIWSAGHRGRLDLGPAGDGIGYGDSPAAARAIRTADQEGLVDYLAAVCAAAADYVAGLTPERLGEVVDDSWDPPVTRGVRLVSMLDDAIAHVAQAAYVAGMAA